MKNLLFLFLLATFVTSASAGDSTNRLHFSLAGFAIAPLDAAPADSTQQTVMMFLPPEDGFSANVNVMIQPYSGSMEDYLALSLKQFKSAGCKVISQKVISKSVSVFEYTGEMHGEQLHWYARAEKSGQHVYLATATSKDSQWEKQATTLKACVDSFKCEK